MLGLTNAELTDATDKVFAGLNPEERAHVLAFMTVLQFSYVEEPA